MATVDLGLVKGADGAAGANGADGVTVHKQEYTGSYALLGAQNYCYAHYGKIIGVYASTSQVNPVFYQLTMKIATESADGRAAFYLPDGSLYGPSALDFLIEIYYLE